MDCVYIKFYACNLLYTFTAPEGPPENLISDRRIDSVTFEWMPPSCPNGIIQRYLFFITMENRTYTRELCANQTTMTVDGFDPYEQYTVVVNASTRVFDNFLDSPPAVLMERTLPDSELFEPVEQVHVCTGLQFCLWYMYLLSWDVCIDYYHCSAPTYM